MACNVGGSKVPSGVQTIEAKEGDTIKVKWDQSGHPGPITHFLSAPVADASQATGIGAWTKIDELAFVDGKWANEIMGAQNMTHEFKLPTGIASGEYLLRSEMLALHASQTLGGGQFYIGCIQLKITGTGGTCGPSIQIPGAYKADDANIFIPNYYNGFDATNYQAPGGDVGTCGGSGSGAAPVAPAPASSAAASSARPVASSAPAAAAPSSATSPAASPSVVAVSSVAVTPTAVAPSAVPTTLITAVASSTAAPSAAPSPAEPAPTQGSGNALPKEFTLSTFIAWLQAQV